MDLWIRSQDKEKLIKTDEIKIEREYIDFKDKAIFHINTAYDELGKYSTKERVLEILGEINRHIEELYNCKYGIEYDLSQFTYEMPEE